MCKRRRITHKVNKDQRALGLVCNWIAGDYTAIKSPEKKCFSCNLNSGMFTLKIRVKWLI